MAHSKDEVPPFRVPDISSHELESFRLAHFMTQSDQHFASNFLSPVEGPVGFSDENDELGFYEDGVKRTLTDEQIAIFRHSEIQALLRERRMAEEAINDSCDDPDTTASHLVEFISLGTGSSENVTPASLIDVKDYVSKIDSQDKCAPKSKKSFYKQNIKPDLRKRTWDKVDTGLESLDYGEESLPPTKQRSVAQRRQISYVD